MTVKSMKLTALAGAIGLAFALPAGAADDKAKDPMEQPDDTLVSVSGTVANVTRDAFVLDYGEGIITVEMDDGDRDADGYKLLEGDKVRVNGVIDDDFFETKTIEASSVYVEDVGTYFYASAMDEEDSFVTITTPVIISATVVQGTVTKVAEDEFSIDTGLREIRVEVEEMAYNPLDDEGYQQIQVGDKVSVAGRMDDDLFEGRELVADSVVTLKDRSRDG